MEPQHLESLYPAKSREKEIAQIFSFVKAGKSMQLIAMPGVGRANLLGLLAYNRNIRIHHVGEKEQFSYHFVMVNFSEIKNRSLFDTMKFLFLELVSSLHERRREEEFLIVDKLFKNALAYQDELVLFQGLKNAVDFLTLEKGLTIVFLFERFETYTSQVSEAFFTNLRSLRGRAKYKFSIIFSTTRPLEDMLESELLADYYEFIADNHIYLSLEDRVGLEFRITYLEKLSQKKIPEKDINQLLLLTAGHGKLTRLGLESLLTTTQEAVDEKYLLSLKTIQGALTEIWRFLIPDEQQDIRHICKDGHCPIPNPFLQKIHLLTNDHFTIPLFASFANTLIKVKKEEKTLLRYDETTNTIQRDGYSISDILTVSEFRLLRLLLEKQGTIVDRETIISLVWSDTKTQSGVSEQAVDQLLLRLRKKIEIDPAHPIYIQTVKGRGVKFVQ